MKKCLLLLKNRMDLHIRPHLGEVLLEYYHDFDVFTVESNLQNFTSILAIELHFNQLSGVA